MKTTLAKRKVVDYVVKKENGSYSASWQATIYLNPDDTSKGTLKGGKPVYYDRALFCWIYQPKNERIYK